MSPGARLRDDSGSTIPLILGFFVLAALLVGGGIAASDAFVDQRSLQAACDGATLAAANAVDAGAVRDAGIEAGGELPLGAVRQAAAGYLARDPARADVVVDTTLSPDGREVQARCEQVLPVTFGAVFGLGGGVRHTATSEAATVLR